MKTYIVVMLNLFQHLGFPGTRSRNKFGMTFILFLTFNFVLLTFNLSEASAGELSLTISPPTATYSLNPGEITQGIIKLINNTPSKISFETRLNDFIVEDSKGTPVMLSQDTFSSRFSASSWITLDSSTFTLKGEQTQEIFYTINVPSSARPGGHYSAILFVPEKKDSNGQNITTVETQIGTLISIAVNGHISEHSQITRFTANAFQEYGPVKLFATIKNFGDLHIKPVGKITVYDLFERTIETVRLEEKNIFPEASRDYEATLGTKFMVGRFKAELSANYGQNNDKKLTSSLYFWVIPWKITLVVILAIITTILAIIYWRRLSSLKFKVQS